VNLLAVQVKVTMERLKAGFEDTLRERDDFSERKIKNVEEQKDKGVYLVLVCYLSSVGIALSSPAP